MTAIDFQQLFRLMKAEHFQSKQKKSQTSSNIKPIIAANDNKMSIHKKKEFMNTPMNFNEQLPIFSPKKHYLPSTNKCYYISNFISSEFEQHILQLIFSAPKANWTQLKRRRLQCYGGKQAIQFIQEELPIWCQQFCDQISVDCEIFDINRRANHLLINEYKPGQGIHAHKDGPKYDQRVVIISLNDILCINFFAKPPSIADLEDVYMEKLQPELQVILEPRSCLIFEGALYTDFFHTIYEKKYDIIIDNVCNLHLIDQQKWNLSIGSRIYRSRKRFSMTIRHAIHDIVDGSMLLSSIDKALEFLNNTIVG